MRVCFLDHYGSLGGGQQVLAELVRAARSLGMEVTALVPGEGGLQELLGNLGVPVRRISELHLAQGRKGYGDFLRLGTYSAALLARHGAFLAGQDLIYVNGVRLLPAMLASSLILSRVRFCYHIHLIHRSLEKRLIGLALSRSNTAAVVVPSAFVREDLVKFSDTFLSPKVRLVRNGLTRHFDCFPFEDRFSGRKLSSVAVVGRLSPEKGQDILLTLAPNLPDISVHVLGDCAFSDAAWGEMIRSKTPVNVRFHGWVEDVPATIRSLGVQVCLVPSRCDEASPLVPLEAMALSCITVVRARGGLAEIASRTGALTFVEDAEVAPLLDHLVALSAQEQANVARSQYAATLAHYGHSAFAGRLQLLLQGLCDRGHNGGQGVVAST